MHRRKNLLFVIILLISIPSWGQIRDKEEFAVPEGFYFEPKPRPIRSFLSKITFGLSFGYGATFYGQKLEDFNVLQDSEAGPVLFSGNINPGDSIPGAISYWYNRIETTPVRYDAGEFVVGGDSTDLKYKSLGHSIPVSVSIHYDFKNYKIGAGFTFEYHRPGEFAPNEYEGELDSYQADFKRTFLKRYYGILGVRLIRYWEYLAGVDARIGVVNFGKEFDKSIMDKGIFINVGIPVEREFSEYFKAFVRPSFDYKSYSLTLPESDNSVTTSMNSFMIEFGITYRIPELPKCFLKKCRTQVNHMHGEYQYRSRVHPFYKWQNPHHGQNYPVLIKYKGRNKKKMNPY